MNLHSQESGQLRRGNRFRRLSDPIVSVHTDDKSAAASDIRLAEVYDNTAVKGTDKDPAVVQTDEINQPTTISSPGNGSASLPQGTQAVSILKDMLMDDRVCPFTPDTAKDYPMEEFIWGTFTGFYIFHCIL